MDIVEHLEQTGWKSEGIKKTWEHKDYSNVVTHIQDGRASIRVFRDDLKLDMGTIGTNSPKSFEGLLQDILAEASKLGWIALGKPSGTNVNAINEADEAKKDK